MDTENIVLMNNAHTSLQGRWGSAVGSFLIYIVLVGGLQGIPIIGTLDALIPSGPIALCIAVFSLALSCKQDAKVEQIFQGFNNFRSGA